MTSQDHGRLDLAAGFDTSGLSIEQLWLRQLSIGGDTGILELEAYVLGLLQADRYRFNLIAQALNDFFVERGLDHPVGYRDLNIDRRSADGEI